MPTLEPAFAAPATGWFVGAFARLRAVRGDQQGAIMVLGIFMCSCIVGVLWYIAGIGDAIVYRERMQEAADAVAFSGATLHARGMNLLVLLNLLMAVVLAIRVALKMLILALEIATVFFGILGAVPFMEWAEGVASATGRAAGQLQSILSDIDPLIDDALVALHNVETVVSRIVPPAAALGSVQVGEKYNPPVTLPFGSDLDEVTKLSLPVTDGSLDMLCRKAGEAVGMVIAWPLSMIPGIGQGMSLFKSTLGSITEAGAGYFCEMGTGGKPPDLDSIYSSNAKQVCDKKQDGNQQKYDQASAAWHQACSATNPPANCMDPGPLNGDKTSITNQDKLSLSDINKLKSLGNQVDQWHQEVENFDDDQCKKDQKKDMQQRTQQQQQTGGGNSGNKTPVMVRTDWKNGVNNSQFLSLITGDAKVLDIGPRGVKVGAFKDRRQKDPEKPMFTKFSFAQAEFFYDCSGDWDSSSCNNEEDTHESAMWHFRWRSRLRRFNAPSPVAKVATEGGLADFGNQFRRFPMYSTDAGNEILRVKLQEVALSGLRNPTEVLIVH